MRLRRQKLTEECRRLAGEEDLTPLAETDLADYAEKMARAERDEL